MDELLQLILFNAVVDSVRHALDNLPEWDRVSYVLETLDVGRSEDLQAIDEHAKNTLQRIDSGELDWTDEEADDVRKQITLYQTARKEQIGLAQAVQV